MDLAESNQGENKGWLRLVALWVLAETVLGGFLHGMKLPVTGLLVGGSAMLCIMMLAWYFPQRGSVLKAMMLVILMKFSLSPHSPFPAYLAVFFQGICGELLLRGRRFFLLKCLLFGFLAMMESALQRLLVMVFISGTEIWEALDAWVSKVSSGLGPKNLSHWLAATYLLVHAVAGLAIGWLGWNLAATEEHAFPRLIAEDASVPVAEKSSRKNKSPIGPIISLLALMLWLLIQAKLVFPAANVPFFVPLILRMFWLYGLLVYFLVPVLDGVFKKVLEKKAARYSEKLEEIRVLLPEIISLVRLAWNSRNKGGKGFSGFLKLLVYSIVHQHEKDLHSQRRQGTG